MLHSPYLYFPCDARSHTGQLQARLAHVEITQGAFPVVFASARYASEGHGGKLCLTSERTSLQALAIPTDSFLGASKA